MKSIHKLNRNELSSNEGRNSMKKQHFVASLMVAILLIMGCSTEPSTDKNSISLTTTKINYSTSDTIIVRIVNDSDDVYRIGLRCGSYLEMYYQVEVDGNWSEDQWFDYMSLRCATVLDSVLSGEVYEFKLPSSWLHGVGSFRLSMNEIYSNGFVVE